MNTHSFQVGKLEVLKVLPRTKQYILLLLVDLGPGCHIVLP